MPRYSFNWQTRYEFKEPVAAPKGSRLECVAHFDNSPKNKWNPDPAKTVRWGPQTWEEMMIGFVGFTSNGSNLVGDLRRLDSLRYSLRYCQLGKSDRSFILLICAVCLCSWPPARNIH